MALESKKFVTTIGGKTANAYFEKHGKLLNRPIVGCAGVRVADRDSKKLEELFAG
jgi:hypothetical protein